MQVYGEKEAEAFLEKNKLPVMRRIFCKTEQQVLAAAKKIKYPVAMKISSARILHKSDVGGVKVDLRNEKELREAFQAIRKIKGYECALVQQFLQGHQLLVGRVEEGRPTLGLCHFPVLGTTIAVAPGVKAYERTHGQLTILPRPRIVRSLHDAVVFHGGIRWWQSTKYFPGFLRLVRTCFLERAYGDCYGYLWALRGHVDAVLDYGVKPWDMAPLAALADATGRVLVNFAGRPSFSGPDTIMASPSLARRICRMLQHDEPMSY